MQKELSAQDYEVTIRRLIFSNWSMVTQEGENPKVRFTIQFGPTHYTWEGWMLSHKVNEPLDALFDKIMGAITGKR